ncbi:uncharacterized protein LOC103317543 [Nasonia vitripennis]|uniref:Reverse transcriptase domain-containing protein n=1 Tax=Nasonia vitripennis TaxID=7425 RepID=A0A7M7H8K3_NASVI|nr:uncharacterized protein LOC103317543 [Nasonia vitripennis]
MHRENFIDDAIGRQQAVISDNNQLSSYLPLNTGFPQGSVLAHLIYVDDLQIHSRCHLEELDSCSVRMNANAERIKCWAEQNNLKLNVLKTKAIVLGSSCYINALPTIAYTFINIGRAQVDFESSVRSLGVVLDSKLTCFFRKSTNLRLRKHLVQVLLFPIIDYCSLVYFNLTQELETKLLRLVNAGIRYIYGLKRDEHVTPYRRELQWLITAGRRNYFTACFLRKLFNTGKPSYLIAYFNFHVALCPVRGDVIPQVKPLSFSSETLRNSFHINATYLWNSLPSQLRNTIPINHFKSEAIIYCFNLENT